MDKTLHTVTQAQNFPAVELHDFRISKDNQPLLHVEQFVWAYNTNIGIVGESGVGKSIFAKSIMGILPATFRASGSMIYHQDPQNAVDLLKLSEEERISFNRGKFNFVFQEPLPYFNPVMKCGIQLQEVVKNPGKDTRDLILSVLASVKLDDPGRAYNSYPHQLSGGQLQRIMIAMSLLSSPEFVIADEPTTSLDKITQAHLIELLSDLRLKYQWGMLLISHDVKLVNQLADHIWEIKNQEIKPLTGSSTTDNVKPNFKYEPDPNPTDRLALCNIKVIYQKRSFLGKSNSVVALNKLNLNLKSGLITGLVGESGCGKSTVAKVIARMITPVAGSVLYRGKTMAEYSRKEWSHIVQMIFQDAFSSLNPRMKIGDALKEVLATSEDANEKINQVLGELNLSQDTKDKYPHAFSGGQRQRIAIARALLRNPRFLVVDESIAGLDYQQQQQVVEMLVRICKKRNMGILFISHDLYWVVRIATEVVVLKKGKMVERGEVAQIVNRPTHPYTKDLLDASYVFSLPDND